MADAWAWLSPERSACRSIAALVPDVPVSSVVLQTTPRAAASGVAGGEPRLQKIAR
jgi:hypothetical protein